jgi:single-strand DNA-binding protein
MRNYNRAILMGHLTRDPELKSVGGDTQVCTFGIAINRRYTDTAGNPQEEVTFVDCEAWNRIAKTITDRFAKGRPIHLEGRLRYDQWQDDEGNNRSKLKFVVESFQFVDERPSSESGEAA